MKPHERILRERGYHDLRPEDGDDAYVAFHVSAGHPEMAFSVECANGDRHAIFYHNIDNLKWHDGAHGEYISFTHRGKAVTVRGRGLDDAYDAILQHRLQRVTELQEDEQAASDAAFVDMIRVTEANDIVQ